MAKKQILNIKVALQGITKVKRQLNILRRDFRNLRKTVFNFKTALFAMGSSAGLGMLARNVIKTSDQFKQYQMTLQALIGDQQKAAQQWKILLKFAEQTPYTITDVMNSYKMMVAYGLKPTVEMMQALGDTAAAVGKDALPRIAYALGQIGAASSIRMQDLMQLQNAGINTKKALQEAFGTGDLQQLNQKIQQGTLSMQQVIDAFVKYMEKHFGGTMKKQMNTLSGQFEILKSYWQEFENAIMSSGLYNFLVQQLKKINNWIETLKKNGKFQDYANKIAEAVAHLTGQVLIAIAKVTKAFLTVYDWVQSHKTVFEIGLIGLVLFGTRGKLLALTALAAMNSESLQKFVNEAQNLINKTVNKVQNTIETNKKELGSIKITKDNESFLYHLKQFWQSDFGFNPQKSLSSFVGVSAVASLNKPVKEISLGNTKSTNKSSNPLYALADAIEKSGEKMTKFKAHFDNTVNAITKKTKEGASKTTKTVQQATRQMSDAERQVRDEIIRIEDGPFAYFRQKLQEQVEDYKKAGVSQELLTRYYNDKIKEYVEQHTKQTTNFMQEMWTEALHNMQDAFGNYFVEAMKGHFHKLADYIVGFLNAVRDAIAQILGQKVGGGIMSSISGALSGLFTHSSVNSMSSSPWISLGKVTSSANGNILIGGFKAFATGGIVTKPTLGIIGEGKYNEAVVPLPDGRHIEAIVKNSSPNVEVNIINKSSPVKATASKPYFNGKRWVLNIVLEGLQTDPDFRSAVRMGVM